MRRNTMAICAEVLPRALAPLVSNCDVHSHTVQGILLAKGGRHARFCLRTALLFPWAAC